MRGESWWQEVACAVQVAGVARHRTLSEAKLRVERVRDELSEKGAAQEWSAYHRDVVRTKCVRESVDEGCNPSRFCKQWIEIEP